MKLILFYGLLAKIVLAKLYCPNFRLESRANYVTFQVLNGNNAYYMANTTLSTREIFSAEYVENEMPIIVYQEGEMMRTITVDKFLDVMNKPNQQYSDGWMTLKYFNCVHTIPYIMTSLEESASVYLESFSKSIQYVYRVYKQYIRLRYKNVAFCGGDFKCIFRACYIISLNRNTHNIWMYSPSRMRCYYPIVGNTPVIVKSTLRYLFVNTSEYVLE